MTLPKAKAAKEDVKAARAQLTKARTALIEHDAKTPGGDTNVKDSGRAFSVSLPTKSATKDVQRMERGASAARTGGFGRALWML